MIKQSYFTTSYDRKASLSGFFNGNFRITRWGGIRCLSPFLLVVRV